jgi:hypothetical protein
MILVTTHLVPAVGGPQQLLVLVAQQDSDLRLPPCECSLDRFFNDLE